MHNSHWTYWLSGADYLRIFLHQDERWLLWFLKNEVFRKLFCREFTQEWRNLLAEVWYFLLLVGFIFTICSLFSGCFLLAFIAVSLGFPKFFVFEVKLRDLFMVNYYVKLKKVILLWKSSCLQFHRCYNRNLDQLGRKFWWFATSSWSLESEFGK